MGGVNEIKQLIAYYRIFLQSKKLTFRLYFTAIDIACCNAWLKYKKNYKYFNLTKKDTLDLLHFKLRVTDSLLNLKQNAKKKRPNQTSTPPTLPTAYNGTSEYLPAMKIRKDERGHFSICCDKQL